MSNPLGPDGIGGNRIAIVDRYPDLALVKELEQVSCDEWRTPLRILLYIIVSSILPNDDLEQ